MVTPNVIYRISRDICPETYYRSVKRANSIAHVAKVGCICSGMIFVGERKRHMCCTVSSHAIVDDARLCATFQSVAASVSV